MCLKQQNLVKYFLLASFLLVAETAAVINAQTNPNRTATKQSVTQMLAEATEAIKNETFAKADVLLKKILRTQPQNVVAHSLAGIAAERQNDLKSAENHFAIAVRLQPNSPEARNNYGAILFRLNRPNEAAKEFEASLKANPNQPSAQANLAQIYFAKGTSNDLTTAQNLFEKVFANSPDIEIARALVVIASRLHQKERAAQNYQQYANLAKDVNLPAAERTELGAVLLENVLYTEAKNELEAANKLEPNNINTILLLSRAFLGQKDIKSAGRILESAVARGANDGRIYAALADVYQAGGYFENAIPAMRLAIEADKKNEAYRYKYGMLLIDTKAPGAAVIRLKESINDFPTSARLWIGLGIAQFYDSKLTDAQQSLKKALTLDSKLVAGMAYLAAISNVNGQSAEAATFYERALAIDQNNSALHYLLADTLLKDATVDNQKVETHLKRAIELDAQLAAAHLALGRLYVRQKRFPEAVVELEKTVQLEPNRAEAFYQLGQVYGRLKRTDESRTALAKFKELSELEKTQTKTEYSELVRRLANVKY